MMFSRGALGRSAVAIFPVAAGNYVEDLASPVPIAVTPAPTLVRRPVLASSASLVVTIAPELRRLALLSATSAMALGIAANLKGLAPIAANFTVVVTALGTVEIAYRQWTAEARILFVAPDTSSFVLGQDMRHFEVPPDPDFDQGHDKRVFS